ncbi:hypothetical protein ACQPZU_10335 [Saccharomonospora azurea]|uniref:hypothetical protein n=1 Tax=Saccharomonospora azurea TaxID=40988 RepID=UPI003D949E5F
MASETSGVSGWWDVYFGEPVAPEGGVNWDAYSHEELYQMLWQDADVADVSTIAAEWAQHRAALVNHAEVLREQKAALLESWQGSGAEEAARRLDVLAQRVEKIAELAHAGEVAAEQAADALAQARAMMPPPPGEASAPMTDAVTNWADLTAFAPPATSTAPTGGITIGDRVDDTSSPADTGVLSSSSSPTTSPSGSTSAADVGTAFGAVGGASFSFYVGADTAELQKQQAVRAMQTYESNLTSSGHLIGQAQGTIPAAATMPSSARATTHVTAAGASSPPPSWQSLAGKAGGLAPGVVAGASAPGAGAVAGFGSAGTGVGPGLAGNALAQGMRVGTMTMHSGSAATAAHLAAESAAARTSAMGGMVPPAGGARGRAEDDTHENQLPTIDHRLFPVQEPGSEAVIGLSPEEAE